ncbi:hypothetical protein [Sphingomonas sp. MMS24-J13]|uniref:hypothetical protein n=1 Tax=Sphingomonas sp. MMS24-J13 TaxID=3238686 RepID=UPI0038512143
MSNVAAALEDLLTAERREREAAEQAANDLVRDRHFMAAERLADRAWSIAEQTRGCPPVPSSIWGPRC